MAALTPVTPTISGTVKALVSAGGSGDTFPNPRGNAFLEVNNGSGGSINVTIAAVATSRPGQGEWPPMTLGNQVVAVGAGAVKVIGPIPSAFVDSSGNTSVTYSATSSVTVGVIQP